MPGAVYRLRMPEPHGHLFHVEIDFPGARGTTELVMPSWTPGSYLMREFPRHVQEFRAEDGNGDPFPFRKTDKNTWRVEATAGPLRVRYAVYANELTVRTSHLDASHGYVNGTGVFMYLNGRRGEPLTLEIEPPRGWRITTALSSAGEPTRFRADSYDELVDSPIEIGTHELLEWEIEDLRHRYAIWGDARFDGDRLIADTTRIVEACAEMFGGLPYPDYTFLLHLVPGGAGGLEHRNSASLQTDPGNLPRPGGDRDHGSAGYERLLGLVAHEFLHVWNGKRIAPAALADVDYTRENYTRSLWIVEGLTTYYTDLILRRAGLISAEQYLQRLGEAIDRLQALPGRGVQTLEEASFDTWIKFYRPDENTPNSQISYYRKGALIGLLLDLEIRRTTENRRSLDDVMRLLWERYGAHDRGFPDEGRGSVYTIAEEVSGTGLGDFFDAYVRGVAELDWERYLSAAGLELRREGEAEEKRDERRVGLSGTAAAPSKVAALSTGEQRVEARLGVRVRDERGRAIVTHVLRGGPAYCGGLNVRDEILAIGGRRITAATLASRLSETGAGEEIEVSLLRRERLTQIHVRIGGEPVRHRVVPVTSPTPLQKSILRDWLRVTTTA